MQTLLRIILFSVLVTSVVGIECETCSATGNSCTGPKEVCKEEQTICTITLVDSSLNGTSETSIEKFCGTPSKCSTPPIIFSMGPGINYRMSVACCKDDCDAVFPDLPPIEVRANGIKCPACLSTATTCEAQMINCTGSETDCFEMTAHHEANGTHVDRTMKGCTSRYVCTAIEKDKDSIFSDGSIVDKAGCTTRPISGAPRSSGILLPTFFGLLLLLF